MKCPNCGVEIPEGHMYCDKCGTEINIVPEFEPEVENEINASLLGLVDELNKDEKTTEQDHPRRRKEDRKTGGRTGFSRDEIRRLIVTAGLVVLLVVGLIVGISVYRNRNALQYMNLAENAKKSGDYAKAIEYLKDAHKDSPSNTDVIFRLSDYYLENGQVIEAVDTLRIITDSGNFSEEKMVTAYESIISIYKQTESYDQLAELLNDNDSQVVQDLKARYLPNMPSISPASGTYDQVSVSLAMADGSSDKIYYTVNDGAPNGDSILYESEIILDADGTYNIKAVAVNEYGFTSVVAENEYVIERGAPAAPEVMEPSGDYNQNTMIVVVAEAGCSIFYTTDGSDPTEEDRQYISPLTMPVGTTHYKFIAYDNEGNCSEIVERDYHLVYSRLVSAEQAVNNLVSTLVRLDILLDTSGKVRGIDGHNEYIYNSIIEIEGAGEYYVVVENHVSYDGKSAPTGLMYAVNTHDGAVNRLGYDSSGKYTLIKISNR
jgi:uncharacterized Zn finger protein (UPF0148 family)